MAAPVIDNVRTKRNKATALDGPLKDLPAQAPMHPLDTEAQLNQLKTIEGWWLEQIDMHAENRQQQLIDCDYYDHEQIDAETAAVLNARNQAPIVNNLVKGVVDWLVGTERRTRVDWSVYPRTAEAEGVAKVKEELLKFVSDTSSMPYKRSAAFKDAVKCGVGWTREYAQLDPKNGIPCAGAYVDWKMVRWDGYSRQDDLSDCRSITIERYLDLDYAIALYPQRADKLRAAASKLMDPSLEYLVDDALMPQVFFGQTSTLMPMAGLSGTMSIGRRHRSRVRLIETEYRRPITTQYVRSLSDDYDELTGSLYSPTNPDQATALAANKITLEDRLTEEMWICVWSPGFMCAHEKMPYNHNKFSLTPTWCYRRHRDGMPYGAVRGIRDPQDEYNKRRSKAMFALSTNRVIYEEDAIAEGSDEEDLLEQARSPDGQIKLAAGAMKAGKFKIETAVDIGNAQLEMMKLAKVDVQEGSGVTRENMGLGQTDQSGKAILAKQQQGAIGTAEIYDNYRQSIQRSGQKMLSLAEQYIHMPMQLRVVGNDGAKWVQLNQPQFDPSTGKLMWQNDITRDEADFVVDEQDYRETVRMAMAEMLMDTISKMPPQLAIQLLDLAIDLTDIPNRAEFVARIRKINGSDQEGQPPTPEQQQQQQQAAQDAQAQRDALAAKTNKDNAAAGKLQADAAHKVVETKGAAMNVAHAVKMAPGVAPAADRIASAGLSMPPTGQPPPQANGAQFPVMENPNKFIPAQ